MKTPKLTKSLFINWSTSDLVEHLTFLGSRPCPNERAIVASLLIEEVLAERGVK